MKYYLLTFLFSIHFIFITASAQQTNNLKLDNTNYEHYGKTLNLAIGVGGFSGYSGYAEKTLPVFHLDYELEVARSFTLAPFISFYTFSNNYYWGNLYNSYRFYNYRETVIPIGVKGTYYFDQLLNANSKWDFYLAGSLGFAIVNEHWDSGYYGDIHHYNNRNPLFLDFHIGTEYHVNRQVGILLDLSTGMSTVGIAIH